MLIMDWIWLVDKIKVQSESKSSAVILAKPDWYTFLVLFFYFSFVSDSLRSFLALGILSLSVLEEQDLVALVDVLLSESELQP